MKRIEVKVTLDKKAGDLGLPSYMSDAASGMDLLAAVTEDVVIDPGQVRLIPTGMRICPKRSFSSLVAL